MIITLDPENTIFLNGKLEDDKSADGNGMRQIVPAYDHRVGRIHAATVFAHGRAANDGMRRALRPCPAPNGYTAAGDI